MSAVRYGFAVNQFGVNLYNNKEADLSHLPFFEQLITTIRLCNTVAKNPSQKIDSVFTSKDGAIIYIHSMDDRLKEVLREDFTPDFCNFLCRLINLHSLEMRILR